MTRAIEILDEAPTEMEDVASRLERFVRHEVPDASVVTVRNLRRTSGGFSRENWVFDLDLVSTGRSVTLPLVLRRDPAVSPLHTERATEFALIRSLAETAVPAPLVYWLDETGAWMGRSAMVMERVEGYCDWTVLNGARPLEWRMEIGRQFTESLAMLQSIDWKALGLESVLKVPDEPPALVEVERCSQEYRRVALEELPEIALAEVWLRKNAPTSTDLVIVHGDYKPGNALVEGDRISALLDWETAHLGDPLEDLGWITNPLRRGEQQIRGAWEVEHIVAEYTRLTGRAVDLSDLRWWNVLACYKLSITNLAGVHGFVSGKSDRVSQTPNWIFRRMLELIEETTNATDR